MIDPDKREKPYHPIKQTIEMLAAIGGSVIVEIGSMRMPLRHPLEEHHHSCCVDGHSTAHWATTGATVYSVDVDPATVATARSEIAKLGHFPNVHVVQGDGISFLNKFDKKIDLLFLDGWDVGIRDYDLRHLEAYIAARPKMSPTSIVSVDDTDVAWDIDGNDIHMSDGTDGKGRLLTPRLARDGFKLVRTGRQMIFARQR